jgi:hypothetical protein
MAKHEHEPEFGENRDSMLEGTTVTPIDSLNFFQEDAPESFLCLLYEAPGDIT